MRIGADIRVLMDKHYSGISEYTDKLLAEILRQDKQNEYKLFYNSYHSLEGRLDKWNSRNSKIIGLHYPNKIFNYFLQKIIGYPLLDKAMGGADVFWSPHFNFTKLSGPESGLKKVITVHDLSFLRYPEFFSCRKNFWHRSLGVIKALKEADGIIAVSENTKNDIMELAGIEAGRIKVIYSGNNVIKKEWPAEKIAACLQKFSLSSPYILYVGNIEPRKNISSLIKAYGLLRDRNRINIDLVLAGASGWKTAKIYRDWRNSPYKDNIRFIGYISAEEKEILYSRASIFNYPSFYEGFGFPPLEAMAYGVPVVCSNVSSLPEVAAGAAIMVNPDKPEEIAEAIGSVLGDEELRVYLIAKGYEQAKLFTWQIAAQKYLEFFKELHEKR